MIISLIRDTLNIVPDVNNRDGNSWKKLKISRTVINLLGYYKTDNFCIIQILVLVSFTDPYKEERDLGKQMFFYFLNMFWYYWNSQALR